MTRSRLLHGIGVSPGISVGPALVLRSDLPEVPHRIVAPEDVEAEVERLAEAIGVARQSLERLRTRAHERVGPEEAKIFDAQILMLEDRDFLEQVEQLIVDNQLTAERAFEFRALELRAVWERSSSSTLRDRVADLAGVQRRVLNFLLGRADEDRLEVHGRPVVVVTRELTPGLTIQFERDHVIGFVSEEGTVTSHAAILARSLGIPCVMGLSHAVERIPNGSEVVIDGARGSVVVGPTPDDVSEAHADETRRKAVIEELDRGDGKPTVTLDGVSVALRGNLDLPEELDPLVRHHADGVGLLRTEFMVVGRTGLPEEDEQVAYFSRVARAFAPAPVVIRSFDVGGDKFPAGFRIAPEANPFLGWRAIRVCLDRPDVFVTQLRAVLRARRDGDVRLLLPLVIAPVEITRTRELIAEARESLARDGIAAADDLPVGVMIETPAAAVLVDVLAEHVDFLSVGTNDLTQYTLAVDRGNARLASRFSPFHLAVLRMLQQVRDAAHAAGRPVAVCGEMASEPLGVFLLLGLGYRELSASPAAVPFVRWLIRRLRVEDAQDAAAEAVAARTHAEAVALLGTRLAALVDLSEVSSGWLPADRRSGTFQERRPQG